MAKPRLKLNDKEIGLRDLGDGLFEPKSLNVLTESLTYQHPPAKNNNGFFVENTIEIKEPKEYHKIQSFCFVVTGNIKEEAELLLKSLREFHDQPVYVICDKESRDHIIDEKLSDNVFFKRDAEQEQLDKINEKFFKNHSCIANNIHNASAIFRKMDVMDFALKHHDNTFFLDADIIVLDNLQEYFTSPIALSPHYHPKGKEYNGFEFGFYNAGYVFCASKGFPKFWKYAYLNDSIFFEQECMNRISDYYKIQTFGKEHNVGFWRGENLPKKAKSVHVHITQGVDKNRSEFILNENQKLKEYADDQTKGIAPRINSYIKKYFNPNAHKKLAFIHFGKCAGNYINSYLKTCVTPTIKNMNSWHADNPLGKNLKRDWTEEELILMAQTEPLKDSYGYTYLVHNHQNSWSNKAIEEFKKNNWFTFTFLRDPKDLICSLYFFSKKLMKNRGVTAVGPNGVLAGLQGKNAFETLDVDVLTLDSFFSKMVTDKNQHIFWKLPSYIDQLDYAAQFNEENFASFLLKNFSHIYTPREKVNTSENKGFKFYYDKGLISTKAKNLIESHPEYIKYSEYL